MGHSSLFKGRHFAAEVILCSVRWYSRYILSYRDVEEILQKCGLAVDHSIVIRRLNSAYSR
jgi:transposase, IS6 family